MADATKTQTRMSRIFSILNTAKQRVLPRQHCCLGKDIFFSLFPSTEKRNYKNSEIKRQNLHLVARGIKKKLLT